MARVRYSFSSRHTGHTQNIDKQRKEYFDVALDVIERSDVILEVIDARYLSETRNPELEELIKKKGKRIIFVVNKVDLLLEQDVLKKIDFAPFVLLSCKKRQGSGRLRRRIKSMLKEIDLDLTDKTLNVGIIGYPNSGKSSLLNILVGKGGAKTSSQPGFTKGLQKMKLTKNIFVLDTPGVITREDYSMNDRRKIAKHTKVGSRSCFDVKDPEMVVQELLFDKEARQKMEKYFQVDSDGDSEKFLDMVAKMKGFLKKGGEADVKRAARLVLRKWQGSQLI